MSHRRSVLLASAVAVGALLLSGCAQTQPAAAPSSASGGDDVVRVASAFGEVDVPANPTRIVSAAYYTVWTLWNLGVEPIATLDYTDQINSFTAEQQELLAEAEPIGGFRQLNFEAISAAKPDLIVGDAFDIDEATYLRLSEIAPTVVAGSDDRGDWQTISQELAAAVGKTDVWEQSKAEYEAKLAETKAEYGSIIDGNRWAIFSLSEPGQFSIQLPGGATGNLLLNELGLPLGPNVPLDDPDKKGWQSYPMEQLPIIFDGVTHAITFATPDGEIYPQIQEVIDSDVFQTTAVARTGAVSGISAEVNDYEGAKQFLDAIVTTVLEPARG